MRYETFQLRVPPTFKGRLRQAAVRLQLKPSDAARMALDAGLSALLRRAASAGRDIGPGTSPATPQSAA